MARMGSTERTAVGGAKARMAGMAAKARTVVMVEGVGMVATAAPEVAMEAGGAMAAEGLRGGGRRLGPYPSSIRYAGLSFSSVQA